MEISSCHTPTLVNESREALDADNIVGTVFMDLSKALNFDLIDHPTLLCKLQRYSVKEKELK